MSKQPFDAPDPIDPQKMAEDVHAFILSDLGKYYMQSLSAKYNEMHHKAELETMTAEQKAFYVERAAGMKFAIDWMINRNGQYESGYYDKK
jgi:hypothetical protein